MPTYPLQTALRKALQRVAILLPGAIRKDGRLLRTFEKYPGPDKARLMRP